MGGKWYRGTISCAVCHVARRQNVVVTSNKVQLSQKTIVQEPCAGTIYSVSYKGAMYGSLCYRSRNLDDFSILPRVH